MLRRAAATTLTLLMVLIPAYDSIDSAVAQNVDHCCAFGELPLEKAGPYVAINFDDIVKLMHGSQEAAEFLITEEGLVVRKLYEHPNILLNNLEGDYAEAILSYLDSVIPKKEEIVYHHYSGLELSHPSNGNYTEFLHTSMYFDESWFEVRFASNFPEFLPVLHQEVDALDFYILNNWVARIFFDGDYETGRVSGIAYVVHPFGEYPDDRLRSTMEIPISLILEDNPFYLFDRFMDFVVNTSSGRNIPPNYNGLPNNI